MAVARFAEADHYVALRRAIDYWRFREGLD